MIACVRAAALLLACSCLSLEAVADDWPMFGRDASRNAVSPEAKPPLQWQVEARDEMGKLVQPGQNIKWQADLGGVTFGDPVVANGLVWIGTNNWQPGNDQAPDASVLACFRAADGKPLYRYVSPRMPQGRHYDWPHASMSCSPLIEGERLWFTTNRCETVCLDIGPLQRGEGLPREIWKIDMIKQFGVVPRSPEMGLCHSCSVGSYRDLIYVITGNGVDDGWTKVAAPEAPSVVCLKRDNGQLVWQDNSPGANIISGQWSSPLVIETTGRAQVVVPQGDGWLRSFDAVTGKLLWKFDINFKTSKLKHFGSGMRNSINATPVLYEGHVYLASGCPTGNSEGLGRLVCIDPNRSGDISSELAVDAAGQPLSHSRVQVVDREKGQKAIANPNSGLIWEYVQSDRDGNGKIDFEEEFHLTTSNVCIKNNLLVATDFSGLTHCLDAKTGKVHWTYDNFAASRATPLIVGDKVYVADEGGEIAIFGLSADPSVAMQAGEPLAEINMGDSVECSPVYAHDTLYVATRHRLLAIQNQVAKAAGVQPRPKRKQPGATFVPTPFDVVDKMLELAGVKATDVVFDLGSSDGRIVIAAAKRYGSKAVGVELDQILVQQSLEQVSRAGVEELIKIERANIFERDLSNADVIAVYLPSTLMDRLLPQLEKVKPGTRIVSHFFKFNDITPEKSVRFGSRDDGDVHEIYLWTTPIKKSNP